jgi:hypothetical protein
MEVVSHADSESDVQGDSGFGEGIDGLVLILDSCLSSLDLGSSGVIENETTRFLSWPGEVG